MLQQIITYVQTASGGSEMITSAIAISVVGSLAAFGRRLPMTIFNKIKRQLVTSVTISNTDGDDIRYGRIAEYLGTLEAVGGIRSYAMTGIWKESGLGKTLVLSVGYGRHHVWYENKIVRVQKRMLDSSGSEKLKEQITLTCFGRKKDIFETLINRFQYKSKSNQIAQMRYKTGEQKWRFGCDLYPAEIESLALNPDFKNELFSIIDTFLESSDRFKELGLAYKLTFLLHGLPGSGKTALIRSLAGKYKRSVCTINLATQNDELLMASFAAIPNGAFVLIEDFDNTPAVAHRGKFTDVQGSELAVVSDDTEIKVTGGLTISGVLNSLDGLVSLNNCFVFLTTNYLEKIDPAIYREGRVDHIIELPNIRSEVVKDHFENLYPALNLKEYPELKAKDITGVKVRSRDQLELIKENLIKLL